MAERAADVGISISSSRYRSEKRTKCELTWNVWIDEVKHQGNENCLRKERYDSRR